MRRLRQLAGEMLGYIGFSCAVMAVVGTLLALGR